MAFISGAIFLILLGCTSGEYKLWLPNTNLGTPENWNAGRAPCGNDVVLIPDGSPVVYMQFNTSIKELHLPKNGELILGKNSALAFTDQPSSDCPDFGGDVEFTAVNPVPWLRPSSWCSTPKERDSCDVITSRLDVEKVPCTFDDVIFPPNNLYFVDMSDTPSTLPVKSLKVAGTSFSTQSFNDFINSTDGQGMFKPPSLKGTAPLDVTRKSCNDVSGCACGNDRPEIFKRICADASRKCPRPRCRKTIQPVGECCRGCGAVFNITRGYGFNFGDFKKLVNDQFFKGSPGVNLTTSVMSEGWLQMVLYDLTGTKSAKLGRKIKADFDADIANGGHKYAIDSVQFSLAMGPPIGPKSSANTGKQLSGGSIAGIVLGVIIAIVLVLIIVVVFVYRRQGKPLPVSVPSLPPMPSFSSLPRMPNMFRRQGRYVNRDQPQTASHIDPGFANPLYDRSPFDDGNSSVKEMELIGAQEIQPSFDASADGGFNNPLYGSQRGAATVQDPSKVEAATGDTGARPSDPETSAASVPVESATGILIETQPSGTEPDSTI